jgi:hypothetical protein
VLLLLVFLMMVLGLFALFLGGGLVAQGYLYQNPADKMPLRALGGAALVAGFVTFWVWVDQRVPGRYNTFFEIRGESTKEFDEFEAVRWIALGGKLKIDASGNYTETTAKFKRRGSGKFYEEGASDKEFVLEGYTIDGRKYMTGAIRVKGPDDPEPVRYNAVLNPQKPKTSPEYTVERRFVEENGSRSVELAKLGTLHIPSTSTVALSLFLNFLLFAVWLAAFWPVLRFSLTHSLIFAGSLAVLTMFAVMPVLFEQNRTPKKTTAAPITAMVSGVWSARSASGLRASASNKVNRDREGAGVT